jgi:tRNA (mo5U34)-methyltransferase
VTVADPIDYAPFLEALARAGLPLWAARLPEQIAQALAPQCHGDLARWRAALSALPAWPVAGIELDRSAVQVRGEAEDAERLHTALMALHPWRKGPFELFGLRIDTEWRSDWKWDRLKDHIAPLAGRRVLDVGCGSGYHGWRMRGAGADLVVGLEPTLVSVMQFHALQRYIADAGIGVLPLGIEQLPPKLRFFDTVFSMGLLYHRRSPFDHLIELRDALRPGGQLVLETLVIEGRAGEVLVPAERYARMGNVWFIPSVPTLTQWLRKVGFQQVQKVNVSVTTAEEQSPTEWMTFQSLPHQLDPNDASLTIEGYPAPRRAILLAEAP